MIRTNIEKLVKISVQGEIDNPHMSPLPASPYLVSGDGKPMLIPMYGGLVYNIKLGDSAMRWAAELIQPGVSIKHYDPSINNALGVYSCVGNKAIVMTGSATGSEGIVVGKSSRFAEHVICSFNENVIDKMAPEDRIIIQSFGVGLQMIDYPDVMVKNLDPLLIQKIPFQEKDGVLFVPVKAIFGNERGGAGAGFNSNNRTVSLMISDRANLKTYGINDLYFGDFVAIENWDSRYGHGFLRDYITIGVVSQGKSFRSGYGPSITTLFTGKKDCLSAVLDKNSSLVNYL